MYKKFFDLKERPFQLVPNPAYLFLSKCHEEALAHLTYALSQGDGFVEVTGEVGTGKTTLCRVFLESLEDDTEIAYIFNPKLNSLELLKAINDEFGIDSQSDNTKDLIDALNAFLLKKKAEGKKVLLLIDEAQNLAPSVMEQIRLLSNLETTTSKLLQIILVGQPELADLLDSRDLRQLAQRITLSCHLTPLSYKETEAYIRHRIHIASAKPGIHFTRAALRAIYRYSRGIPRLINIASDRALLTAYVGNQRKITGSVAKTAIGELAGRGDRVRPWHWNQRLAVFFGASLVALIALTVYWHPIGIAKLTAVFRNEPVPAVELSASVPKDLPAENEPDAAMPHAPDPAPVPEAVSALEPETEVTENPAAPEVDFPATAEPVDEIEVSPEPADLTTVLQGLDNRTSRRQALEAAMGLWNWTGTVQDYLDEIDDDLAYFRFAARQGGLAVYRIEQGFDLLKGLNLPAVVELYAPGVSSARYLAIRAIEDDMIRLVGGPYIDPVAVTIREFMRLWSGVAYIPWKNFFSLAGVIPQTTSSDSIVALKMLLQDIGYRNIEISPIWDDLTRNAVMDVQARHGIKVDGIVGPLTKIVLYNERRNLNIPHLIND